MLSTRQFIKVNAKQCPAPVKTINKPFYKARNPKQQKYIDMLESKQQCIVVSYGAAGSAKTALGVAVGLQKLMNKEVDRIVITRPAVTVDAEQFGWLPGTLNDKFMPFLMPVIDALEYKMDKEKIMNMIHDNLIEIAPLAFCRGRTFSRCWIVCDEAQNTTPSQMLMILTRIGKDSKMVLTGDPAQCDKQDSGFMHFVNMVKNNSTDFKEIGIVEFTEQDVERHPIIPKILNLYSLSHDVDKSSSS